VPDNLAWKMLNGLPGSFRTVENVAGKTPDTVRTSVREHSKIILRGKDQVHIFPRFAAHAGGAGRRGCPPATSGPDRPCLV